MTKTLTICSGSDADTLGAVIEAQPSAKLVFLPREEYGPYEAFIRRSEALRTHARGESSTIIVDRGFVLSGTQNRMLERVVRGLSATLVGAPWCGMKPQTFPQNMGPGIGNWEAKILMVGAGPLQTGTPPYWPYISSRPDGPAAWLTEQLEMYGVLERDLYWVNAQTAVDGLPVDEPLPTIQPWKYVCCLGDDAFDWATRQYLPNVVLEHYPTWWWNYRQGKDLPAMVGLREALRKQ